MTTKLLVIAGAVAGAFMLSACNQGVTPPTQDQFSTQKVGHYECVLWIPPGAEAEGRQMFCFEPRNAP